MHDLSWSPSEKKIARSAFDEALEIAGTDKTNFTFGVCTLDQPGCFPSIFCADQNPQRKASQDA